MEGGEQEEGVEEGRGLGGGEEKGLPGSCEGVPAGRNGGRVWSQLPCITNNNIQHTTTLTTNQNTTQPQQHTAQGRREVTTPEGECLCHLFVRLL